MNTTLKTTLATTLLVALLAACAAPAPAPATKPAATRSAPKQAAAAPASNNGEQIVCTDDSPTGSNIRRHHCERLTEEQRRQRQAQIDALQRPSTANAARPSGIQ